MFSCMDTDRAYVANTYARFPICLTEGKGSLVYDEKGREYIDMGTGIGVNAFGLADDIWQKAITDQLSRLPHTSNLYYTEPCAALAKLLCEKTGMKKVFFSNSGAEANECAIKVARKYAAEKKGEDYHTVVTLQNSFHGRTLSTLAATGQDHFHKLFQPLTPGFVSVEAGNIEAMKIVIAQHKVAAVMVECVQGEGGVIAQSKEYLRSIDDLCKENGILLIIDEVQTGNGRCGSLYAYMQYGISPDIVSTAKGLGGGLPIGATMMNEKTESVLGKGDHGSTFGGNPVCCAGAMSIIERIDDTLLTGVKERSDYIFSELQGQKGIESLSGLGLMIGIQTTVSGAEIVKKCMERGVLCLTAKAKVRLLPALNIPFEQLQKAVQTIKEVCAESVE